MPRSIHPTAVIGERAYLADNVEVGPYSIVGDDVQIGEGTVLETHVIVEPGVRLGRNCHVWPGAALGGPPQDHKYRGEKSLLVIGDNNTIREYVTIHRAVGEGVATRIANDNMIMAYVHIGHNCDIGSGNTISSYVGLSGHVSVDDNTVMGGMVGVHQFCRVGRLSMIGGLSKVNQDIPPFMISDGVPARVLDLNRIGLRRAGVPPQVRTALRQAYKLLYRSNLNVSQAVERIQEEVDRSEELDFLLAFVRGTQAGFGGRGNDAR